MVDVMDKILHIQTALMKAQKLTNEIHGKIINTKANNNVKILKNYIKKAKKKLTDIKNSATEKELAKKF